MAYAPDNSSYFTAFLDEALTNSRVLGSAPGLSFNPSTAGGTATYSLIGLVGSLNTFNSTGILTVTAGGTSLAGRTLTGSSSIHVLNGDGVAGDPTFSVVDNTSVQKTNIYVDTSFIGTQAILNLIPGSNISLSGSNNIAANRIDVTINASGGGGGGGAPTDATYLLKTPNGSLTNALALSTITYGTANQGLLLGSSTGDLTAINMPDIPDAAYMLYSDGPNSLTVLAPPAGASILSFQGTFPNDKPQWIFYPLGLTYGGVGINSLAQGELMYGTGTDTVSVLPAPSQNSFLTFVGPGIPNAPQWANLPIGANLGGTGLTTQAAGLLPYYDGTTTMATVAAPGAANKILTSTSATAFGWAVPSFAPKSATYITINNETPFLPGSFELSTDSTINETIGTNSVTLGVVNGSSVQKIDVLGNGVFSSASTELNFVTSATNAANVTTALGRNVVTFDAIAGSSIQKVSVLQRGGSIVASANLDFVDGTNTTVSVTNVGGVARIAYNATGGGGSGTVTSVELTSPNGNLILSGTNPITTSGTIDINIGMPIFYDIVNANMSIGPTTLPTATGGGANTIYSRAGVPSLTTAARNVLIGDAPGKSITTGIDNIAIGKDPLNSLTIGVNNIAIGSGALGSFLGAGFDDSVICMGTSSGTLLTAAQQTVIIGHQSGAAATTALGTCIVGNNSFPTTTDINYLVAVGNNIQLFSGSTFNQAVFFGNGCSLGTGSHVGPTCLGGGAGVTATSGSRSATALGYNSNVTDTHQIQLGEDIGVSLSIYPYTASAAPTPLGASGQMVMWLDNATFLFTATSATNNRAKGAFVLAQKGVTTGTVSIGPGVNSVASVTSTIIDESGPGGTGTKVFLMARPVAPNSSWNPADTTQMVVQNMSNGVGFEILAVGTLSQTVYVDWFAVNSAS